MKLIKKHKKIITAFLLALYAFTATPVSYWHHHKSTFEKNIVTKQHSQVVEESNVAVDDNCKICSHHYSIALNDASTVYFSPIHFFNRVIDLSSLKKIANPGNGQSNRGPPSAA